jgi:hypothetical protein
MNNARRLGTTATCAVAPVWLVLSALVGVMFYAPLAAQGGDPLGTDIALPCGEQPQQASASCLATGPTPGEVFPLDEAERASTSSTAPAIRRRTSRAYSTC